MSVFLRLLNKLSANISESELSSLNFLCREKIGRRKLEGVSRGIDLFAILLEQRDMSAEQTDFLKYLLKEINRIDLVEQLDAFIQNGTNAEGEELDPNQQERLRAAYDVICENVGRDWRTLIRALGVNDTKIETIVDDNPRNMREQLRKCLVVWQRIKGQEAHVDILVKTLRGCKMVLVSDKVEERLRNI